MITSPARAPARTISFYDYDDFEQASMAQAQELTTAEVAALREALRCDGEAKCGALAGAGARVLQVMVRGQQLQSAAAAWTAAAVANVSALGRHLRVGLLLLGSRAAPPHAL